MSRIIWLASYPKSGNTWFRLLLANLSAAEAPVDINGSFGRSGMASARAPFEHLTLLDSGLLTDDEIDCLRPRVYEALARSAGAEQDETSPVRFMKVHDAYALTPNGEALLAGRRAADGAIVIVRDPRDVAPSLANHDRTDIDRSISLMNDRLGGRRRTAGRRYEQFRQLLPTWSGHVASWLDQTDLPVHLIRYEDMLADTLGVLRQALAFAGLAASDDEMSRAVAHAAFTELRSQEQAHGFREAPRRPGGPFFRRGEAGAWREELTADQVARLEAAHAPMMRRLGYQLDPTPASDNAPSV
jgi:aryl sulfotransferase